MNDFSNSILAPENLPHIEKETFNPLEKNYLKILFIRLAIFFVFLIGGISVAFIFNWDEIPTVVIISVSAFVLFWLVYAIVITKLGFPKKGYLVRENDISFKRGLITYKQTTVPFNRIQHVEVNQGVLAKMMKLSSLKIFTAGGNASDISIPGIHQETAENLKVFLSEKISEHE